MKFNHFCSSSERGRVFVGMSFTSITSPLVFDAITRACGAIGLQAIRVDQSPGSPPIPQEIERLLRSVDFAIFDLTDVKPNVLNEIGFAGGTGVPESRVLLVAPKGTAIPFNISHRLIRFYRDPKHLTEIVQNCLAEMLAKRQSEAESLPVPIKFPGGEVSGPKVVSHGDHNVVVAGDHNKIEIKSPRRSSQRLPLIPGTLGEHPLMKGYLDYLVDRYNEFKEWEAGHASKKPAWARIRVDYKREI